MGLVGPERERCHITKREDSKWWQVIAKLYLDDQREIGRVRPSFGVVGTDLLKSNGEQHAE